MVDIKKLEKLAISGKLKRREFIKRAVALGLAASFATTMFSQSVHPAIPKKRGKFVLVFGYVSTTDSLVPVQDDDDFVLF